MNETRISEEPTEIREDGDADRQKWADAIQNLVRIIERSEQKLGYFQNRVKQAAFMERPNQRMIRAAGAQVGVHSAQVENLIRQLHQLERLHSGGVHLRQPTENEFRRIWGWIDRPGIREVLYTTRVPLEQFLSDWQAWLEDEHIHALAIETRATQLLIGFMLFEATPDTLRLRILVLGPEYRARGYGTDALVEGIHYAFEHLAAEQITLQVSHENGAALVCFENAGFQYLGYADTAEHIYTMGIERREWRGEAPVDEQAEAPRLSTPLKVFFEPNT